LLSPNACAIYLVLDIFGAIDHNDTVSIRCESIWVTSVSLLLLKWREWCLNINMLWMYF